MVNGHRVCPVADDRPIVYRQIVEGVLRAPLEESLENQKKKRAAAAERKRQRREAASGDDGATPDTHLARDCGGAPMLEQLRANQAKGAAKKAQAAASLAADAPKLLRELMSKRDGAATLGVCKLKRLIQWRSEQLHLDMPAGCIAREKYRETLVQHWAACAPEGTPNALLHA